MLVLVAQLKTDACCVRPSRGLPSFVCLPASARRARKGSRHWQALLPNLWLTRMTSSSAALAMLDMRSLEFRAPFVHLITGAIASFEDGRRTVIG